MRVVLEFEVPDDKLSDLMKLIASPVVSAGAYDPETDSPKARVERNLELMRQTEAEEAPERAWKAAKREWEDAARQKLGPARDGHLVADHVYQWDAEQTEDEQRATYEFARDVCRYAGSGTWHMVVAAAKAFPDTYFTVESLAKAMSLRPSSVRSRLRTLGRSAAWKGREQNAPWLKTLDGYSRRSLYYFAHPGVSEAILRVAREAEEAEREWVESLGLDGNGAGPQSPR